MEEKIYDQIAIRIIREQELIIGPLAWDEARKVQGILIVDQKKGEVSMSGDSKQILNNLVAQYAKLFGRASNEVCKEVTQDLIAELPADQVPESLK
jgi:hypothetical protein